MGDICIDPYILGRLAFENETYHRTFLRNWFFRRKGPGICSILTFFSYVPDSLDIAVVDYSHKILLR